MKLTLKFRSTDAKDGYIYSLANGPRIFELGYVPIPDTNPAAILHAFHHYRIASWTEAPPTPVEED